MVVPLEFEGEFQSWVNWEMGGREVSPCEEQSIDHTLPWVRFGLIVIVMVDSFGADCM